MSKGVIIYLDNDEGLLKTCSGLFRQMPISSEFDFITCKTPEEFNGQIDKFHGHLKSLILDLFGQDPGTSEIDEGKARFLQNINDAYAAFNIPIFIYSGHLGIIRGKFQNSGTVIEVDKKDSIQIIFDKIMLFNESGFLDIFCPGGFIDRRISSDLHRVFTGQFKGSSDIEKIIQSIKASSAPEKFTYTTKRIFTRIAVRSLLMELSAPDVDEKGKLIKETHLGATEHYINRISGIDIWTGDIFKKKEAEEYIFILTPRCNLEHSVEILCCPFKKGELPSKPDKDVDKWLHGDPNISGYNRYIPPCAIFEGGYIVVSKFHMIKREYISTNYERIITLSEELTNEILGKFGAYFFRTGITPWDEEEIETALRKTKTN